MPAVEAALANVRVGLELALDLSLARRSGTDMVNQHDDRRTFNPLHLAQAPRLRIPSASMSTSSCDHPDLKLKAKTHGFGGFALSSFARAPPSPWPSPSTEDTSPSPSSSARIRFEACGAPDPGSPRNGRPACVVIP